MGWAARQNAARRAAGDIPTTIRPRRLRLVGRPLTLGDGVLARYVDQGWRIVRAVPKVRGKAAVKAAKRARITARRSA